MDWATLIADRNMAGSISQWLNSSLAQSMFAIFIAEAENMMYRRLRHFRMLMPPTTSTMTVGRDPISCEAASSIRIWSA
jgi:hypothetical protein